MKRKISLLLLVLLVFAFTQILASAETQSVKPEEIFTQCNEGERIHKTSPDGVKTVVFCYFNDDLFKRNVWLNEDMTEDEIAAFLSLTCSVVFDYPCQNEHEWTRDAFDFEFDSVCNLVVYAHYNKCIAHEIKLLVGTPALLCRYDRYVDYHCSTHDDCDNNYFRHLGTFEGVLSPHAAGGTIFY